MISGVCLLAGDTLGCARFGFVCANTCAPHNAIAMEKFTPTHCETAKIHRNEHTLFPFLVENPARWYLFQQEDNRYFTFNLLY